LVGNGGHAVGGEGGVAIGEHTKGEAGEVGVGGEGVFDEDAAEERTPEAAVGDIGEAVGVPEEGVG
jgi:hypothetical protein